jgi:hypothetical protein
MLRNVWSLSYTSAPGRGFTPTTLSFPHHPLTLLTNECMCHIIRWYGEGSLAVGGRSDVCRCGAGAWRGYLFSCWDGGWLGTRVPGALSKLALTDSEGHTLRWVPQRTPNSRVSVTLRVQNRPQWVRTAQYMGKTIMSVRTYCGRCAHRIRTPFSHGAMALSLVWPGASSTNFVASARFLIRSCTPYYKEHR